MFRYRKPSLKRMVGITRVKKAVRKATGLNTVVKYTKPSRIKQRIKQNVGLYSPTMRTIRQTAKGKLPMPMVPEVSLMGHKKNQVAKPRPDQSNYEVHAKKLDEFKCPRCGYSLGEPRKGYKGLFFRQEYQYLWCNGCKTKYNISQIEGTWRCDFCSEKFLSREKCEEHEKMHRKD